ncbi:DHS-like NAD/FAD-binding domain-containing protein [Zychaea mexicana]|uniref:DHS-like NAD/FAD-binding domain-containing protein n=1 Tax=Zychaea mexicana TaxID=64656 RepID=UPI0022FEFFD4|nr:DHS-like NAD/FAD-binding domain-containing protein [Zychaea mexicana]KAI9490907.1 DHS-like NAD/FAD-binding domain-containing protein [Zychaea mexicana]
MVKIVISDPAEIIEQRIAEVAAYVNKSRRALVVTGAGISCSGGIPDFRSSDGLYNLVKARHPGTVLKGAELFDATLFKDVNRIKCFYTFMAELKTLVATAKPTPTHKFLRNMQESGRLLRLYTQNIDDLEAELDLPAVQLHGTMASVKCTLCSASYAFSKEYVDAFRQGEPPICPKCEAIGEERSLLGKRQLAVGTLRPDIVLYNEEHPNGDKIGLQQCSDIKRRPDLLVVLGTSLKIPALKKFVKLAARTVHNNKNGITILVNKTPPTKEWEHVFDYQIMGDTDEWVRMTEAKLEDKPCLTAAWSRIQQRLKQQQLQQHSNDDEDEKENQAAIRLKKAAANEATTKRKSTGQTTLDNYRVSKRALSTSKPPSTKKMK